MTTTLSQSDVIALERRLFTLSRNAAAAAAQVDQLDKAISETKAGILAAQRAQLTIGPRVSAVTTAGSRHRAAAIQSWQAKQANSLEANLNRFRSLRDRLEGELHDLKNAINLHRREAVAQRGDFEARRTELDTAKAQLALALERANSTMAERDVLQSRTAETAAKAKANAAAADDQDAALRDAISGVHRRLQECSDADATDITKLEATFTMGSMDVRTEKRLKSEVASMDRDISYLKHESSVMRADTRAVQLAFDTVLKAMDASSLDIALDTYRNAAAADFELYDKLREVQMEKYRLQRELQDTKAACAQAALAKSTASKQVSQRVKAELEALRILRQHTAAERALAGVINGCMGTLSEPLSRVFRASGAVASMRRAAAGQYLSMAQRLRANRSEAKPAAENEDTAEAVFLTTAPIEEFDGGALTAENSSDESQVSQQDAVGLAELAGSKGSGMVVDTTLANDREGQQTSPASAGSGTTAASQASSPASPYLAPVSPAHSSRSGAASSARAGSTPGLSSPVMVSPVRDAAASDMAARIQARARQRRASALASGFPASPTGHSSDARAGSMDMGAATVSSSAGVPEDILAPLPTTDDAEELLATVLPRWREVKVKSTSAADAAVPINASGFGLHEEKHSELASLAPQELLNPHVRLGLDRRGVLVLPADDLLDLLLMPRDDLSASVVDEETMQQVRASPMSAAKPSELKEAIAFAAGEVASLLLAGTGPDTIAAYVGALEVRVSEFLEALATSLGASSKQAQSAARGNMSVMEQVAPAPAMKHTPGTLAVADLLARASRRGARVDGSSLGGLRHGRGSAFTSLMRSSALAAEESAAFGDHEQLTSSGAVQPFFSSAMGRAAGSEPSAEPGSGMASPLLASMPGAVPQRGSEPVLQGGRRAFRVMPPGMPSAVDPRVREAKFTLKLSALAQQPLTPRTAAQLRAVADSKSAAAADTAFNVFARDETQRSDSSSDDEDDDDALRALRAALPTIAAGAGADRAHADTAVPDHSHSAMLLAFSATGMSASRAMDAGMDVNATLKAMLLAPAGSGAEASALAASRSEPMALPATTAVAPAARTRARLLAMSSNISSDLRKRAAMSAFVAPDPHATATAAAAPDDLRVVKRGQSDQPGPAFSLLTPQDSSARLGAWVVNPPPGQLPSQGQRGNHASAVRAGAQADSPARQRGGRASSPVRMFSGPARSASAAASYASLALEMGSSATGPRGGSSRGVSRDGQGASLRPLGLSASSTGLHGMRGSRASRRGGRPRPASSSQGGPPPVQLVGTSRVRPLSAALQLRELAQCSPDVATAAKDVPAAAKPSTRPGSRLGSAGGAGRPTTRVSTRAGTRGGSTAGGQAHGEAEVDAGWALASEFFNVPEEPEAGQDGATRAELVQPDTDDRAGTPRKAEGVDEALHAAAQALEEAKQAQAQQQGAMRSPSGRSSGRASAARRRAQRDRPWIVTGTRTKRKSKAGGGAKSPARSPAAQARARPRDRDELLLEVQTAIEGGQRGGLPALAGALRSQDAPAGAADSPAWSTLVPASEQGHGRFVVQGDMDPHALRAAEKTAQRAAVEGARRRTMEETVLAHARRSRSKSTSVAKRAAGSSSSIAADDSDAASAGEDRPQLTRAQRLRARDKKDAAVKTPEWTASGSADSRLAAFRKAAATSPILSSSKPQPRLAMSSSLPQLGSTADTRGSAAKVSSGPQQVSALASGVKVRKPRYTNSQAASAVYGASTLKAPGPGRPALLKPVRLAPSASTGHLGRSGPLTQSLGKLEQAKLESSTKRASGGHTKSSASLRPGSRSEAAPAASAQQAAKVDSFLQSQELAQADVPVAQDETPEHAVPDGKYAEADDDADGGASAYTAPDADDDDQA